MTVDYAGLFLLEQSSTWYQVVAIKVKSLRYIFADLLMSFKTLRLEIRGLAKRWKSCSMDGCAKFLHNISIVAVLLAAKILDKNLLFKMMMQKEHFFH